MILIKYVAETFKKSYLKEFVYPSYDWNITRKIEEARFFDSEKDAKSASKMYSDLTNDICTTVKIRLTLEVLR